MSEFRSFVSVNPQVKAAIAAKPVANAPIQTKHDTGAAEEAAERTAEDEAATQEDSSSSDSDSSSPDSSSSDSLSDSSSDASSNSSPSDSSSSDASSSDGTSGSIVETLISDMSEMNDLPLIDVNPVYGFSRGPGYVTWGNDSRGLNYMLPWFVQFEGEGNAASNTRTQIRNLTTFIKSRSTGEWTQVIDSDSYEGIECIQGGNYYNCPQQAEVRIDEDQGAASSSPLPGLNLHGWWGARVPIDGSDIAAVVVSLQARLIVDSPSGVDDRSDAKYLIHIGAEYYPADAPPVNNDLGPIGVSRSKLVTSEWQTFALTTLNDVGMQEPGGGISSDELRADPPPLP